MEMKTLNMEELTEINGGGVGGDIKGGIWGWVAGKALDWAASHPPKNYGPDYNSTSRLL